MKSILLFSLFCVTSAFAMNSNNIVKYDMYYPNGNGGDDVKITQYPVNDTLFLSFGLKDLGNRKAHFHISLHFQNDQEENKFFEKAAQNDSCSSLFYQEFASDFASFKIKRSEELQADFLMILGVGREEFAKDKRLAVEREFDKLLEEAFPKACKEVQENKQKYNITNRVHLFKVHMMDNEYLKKFSPYLFPNVDKENLHKNIKTYSN